MAIGHFKVTNHRVSATRGASRVVDYLTRAGRYAPEQEAVDYLTRTSEATSDRDDLVHQEVANLPAWAHGDSRTFFSAAEQYERANGRWAQGWQLALPRELNREQQLALARTFLDAHLHDKPYLFVLHDPVNADGRHQPHIHVMFSERSMDGIERGPAQHFRRYNATHPERGGAQKDAWFHQRNSVGEIRHAWADLSNVALEQAGHAERIHPGSLYSRGIDREPEPKVGYRRNEDASDRQQAIRDSTDRELEQAQARDAWTQRKASLGITDVHAVTLAHVAQQGYSRARGVQPGHWSPGSLTDRQRGVQREQRRTAALTRDVKRLEVELRILTRRLDTIDVERLTRDPEHHRQQLARDGERIRAKLHQRLAANRSQQQSPGSGLRARLREEEPEYGQGYGR